MRGILRWMKEMLRVGRGSLLLFETVYRIFTGVVLTEAAVRGISFALKQAGFSYLTAGNALRFFLSPMTILVLMGFLLLCLFFGSLEMCVLYTVFQARMAKESMSLVQMLFFGMKNLVELFQTGNARVLLLNANYYLLSQSWILLRLLQDVRPLSYIYAGLSGISPVKAALAVLLAVMLFVTLRYLFVPAVSTLRDTGFKESCRRCRELFRRHWFSVILHLAAVNFLVWLFYHGGQMLAKVLAALLVVLFADKTMELALILTVGGGIEIFALYAASVLGICLNVGILTYLLYCYQDKKYQLEIPPYHYHLPVGVGRFLKLLMVLWLAVAGAVYAYDSIYRGAIKPSAVISEAEITSHRGNSFEAPENTLPALEAAIDSMSDYVEIDIQETKDDVIVLYHDAGLERITGQKGRLWEYTYGELLPLDFGGWFSEDFAGVQIPTLAEALEICQGNIKMNIELKADRYSDTLVDQTLALIEEYHMEAQVVLTSTSYRYLKEIKEKNPDITTGFILSAAYGNYFDDENVDFFSIRSSFVTRQLVEQAHDHGKAVHVWTVNTKSELNRMKRLQVDNIITDRPLLAREILYREEDTENLLEFIKLALRVEK